ncbi:ABC transporter, permease protein [Oribacterium sp. oral taxon 078 str. F0262]|uniref:carbohydrate ABC transporter permease n=1 Tax=Oribacterium sp. oral taxon 078 TaxID=652706 RepID=UPI0001CDEE66|nr:sugar ABC transporter permease [Oribacterium sp. oral taxon 078]EFE92544.1 ABC transporter, permease protein [Oribacterium sp. oral taxon 078 str. F0262]
MKVLRDKKAIALFLSPALLVYSVLVMIPIALTFYYSVLDWDGLGEKRWIGLGNFAKLMRDAVFVRALSNNLVYILIVMLMQLGIGFLIALLLTYLKKGRGFIQTVYYIPSVITVIAVAQLFTSFYSYEPIGLFNIFRKLFGLAPIAFLSEYRTVLPAVASVEGWQYIGIYMLIFYSALVSVSPDIIEAARIDGASETQLLFKVRIPSITNVILLSGILSLVGALRGFAAPMNMTKGGPNHRSEILATYMYKKAFTSRDYGYGSALAVVIVILSIVAVLLISRYMEREEI